MVWMSMLGARGEQQVSSNGILAVANLGSGRAGDGFNWMFKIHSCRTEILSRVNTFFNCSQPRNRTAGYRGLFLPSGSHNCRS